MSLQLRPRAVFGQRSQMFSVSRSGAGRGGRGAQVVTRFLPPHIFVFLSMLSVQLGAAFAKSLFSTIGSMGTVFLRAVFAAVILLVVWRPKVRGYTRGQYGLVLLFGLAIAAMTTCFYAAIARLPLGIAVTLEFLGPLGVALVSSRRLRDVLWAVLALAGVVLLAPLGGVSIDLIGVLLALLAAVGWAAYILLNARVGRSFAGGEGLALGMGAAALFQAPFGVASLGVAWKQPMVFFVGLGVAVLSTVIPFSLEMEALRQLPARVFGILMSLEPVIAALIGLIVLGEVVGLRAIVAMALIVVASGGASFFEGRHR